MSELLHYDAARAALAKASNIDEVKDIHDKAEAMRQYARMAKDIDLEIMAADIRLRSERQLGIMLEEQKRGRKLSRGGRPKTGSEEEPVRLITLESLGIDKKQSRRAQKLGSIAERAFEAVVARTRSRILERNGHVSLDVLAIDKKQYRANRELSLAEMQSALPEKKYGVILADPEWHFKVRSAQTGMDRHAGNHYPTSGTDEICVRPVESIAADDCALFLWGTVPMLPDALRVMDAWGFDYKSHCMWRKDKIGTGYWFRNAHELLLVGTRGKIPAPAMGEQWESVIDAAVAKHSAKPDVFYNLIEEYFPNLPKIELNARRARDGWDAWGLEAPAPAPPHDPVTGEIAASV